MVPLADHHPGWSANRRGVQLCGSPDKPEDVRSHGRPAHTTPSETKPAVGIVDEWSSAAVSTACIGPCWATIPTRKRPSMRFRPATAPIVGLGSQCEHPSRTRPTGGASVSACARAKANLLVEGAGHSAALHSNNEEHIRQMGVELPVSRLVVNQASALTAGGSLTNVSAPTTTLGCGSWGGTSISENLDYKHLMNVSRIGKPITKKKVPTDEEIWA